MSEPRLYMNPLFRALWVADLRAHPEYWGQRRLARRNPADKDDPTGCRCCLGQACYTAETYNMWPKPYIWTYSELHGSMALQLRDQAHGEHELNHTYSVYTSVLPANFFGSANDQFFRTLYQMNDDPPYATSASPWPAIADFIEANFIVDPEFTIPVTEHILPHGEKHEREIILAAELAPAWAHLLRLGFSLECEVLRTGDKVFYICHNETEWDAKIRVFPPDKIVDPAKVYSELILQFFPDAEKLLLEYRESEAEAASDRASGIPDEYKEQ